MVPIRRSLLGKKVQNRFSYVLNHTEVNNKPLTQCLPHGTRSQMSASQNCGRLKVTGVQWQVGLFSKNEKSLRNFREEESPFFSNILAFLLGTVRGARPALEGSPQGKGARRSCPGVRRSSPAPGSQGWAHSRRRSRAELPRQWTRNESNREGWERLSGVAAGILRVRSHMVRFLTEPGSDSDKAGEVQREEAVGPSGQASELVCTIFSWYLGGGFLFAGLW